MGLFLKGTTYFSADRFCIFTYIFCRVVVDEFPDERVIDGEGREVKGAPLEEYHKNRFAFITTITKIMEMQISNYCFKYKNIDFDAGGARLYFVHNAKLPLIIWGPPVQWRQGGWNQSNAVFVWLPLMKCLIRRFFCFFCFFLLSSLNTCIFFRCTGLGNIWIHLCLRIRTKKLLIIQMKQKIFFYWFPPFYFLPLSFFRPPFSFFSFFRK